MLHISLSELKGLRERCDILVNDESEQRKQAAATSQMLPLKRKEKARIAARARRSQEASIIMEMAEELNITQEKKRRIDKATIVRLAIDYIKAFEVLCRRNQQQPHLRRLPLPHPQHLPLPQHLPYPQPHTQQLQQGNRLHHHHHQQQSIDKLAILSEEEQAPRLSTSSIFAPKTRDMDRHFLMIDETRDGKPAFVFKPDDQIVEEDDLTHLAPQAGDSSISLDAESLDGIELDSGLFLGSGVSPLKRWASHQQNSNHSIAFKMM